MTAGKRSFVLYMDNHVWIRNLSDEQKGRLLDALFDYAEDVCDTEICFRALYAAMLYRIKGDKKRAEAINDTIELVSPVVAELAAMYGKVERGEIDLFENM